MIYYIYGGVYCIEVNEGVIGGGLYIVEYFIIEEF